MSHILVIANETAASKQLLDAVRGEASAGVDLVTVLAPVNAPSGGYVVYEDTRRAAAGRRLNRTLDALHQAGISAHGLVVDTSPVDAVKDALAQLEPPPDRIVVLGSVPRPASRAPDSTSTRLDAAIEPSTYNVPSGPNARSMIDVMPLTTTEHAGLDPQCACRVPGSTRTMPTSSAS